MQDRDVGVLIIDGDDEIIPTGSELHSSYDISRIEDLAEFTGPIKEHEVEIVLFDRDQTDLSVDLFLDLSESLRYETKIAVVTDGEPELEIVRKGVDAFITKPPTQEEVEETIEDLIERVQVSQDRSEFWSLISARETLESKRSSSELERHEEYAEIRDRIDDLSGQLRESGQRLQNEAEFVSELRDIEKRL